MSGQHMTFTKFKASGRYVDDLREIDDSWNYECETPGRVYAGGLVIEGEGPWCMTIGNSTVLSDDLEALELELYEFGNAEQLF